MTQRVMNVHTACQTRALCSRLALAFTLYCLLPSGMLPSVSAQGNRVTFSQGGTIAADVQIGTGKGANAVVTTPEGVKIVVLAERIKRETGMRKELLAYRATAPLLPETVEAHLQMGRACLKNRLSAEANRHFLHVLELDPEHEETHRMLQHVKVDGVWVSQKERMEQKGYTRYAGQLMTQQEIELEKKRESVKQSQIQWRKRIKAMVKDFEMRKIRIEDFRQIKDPLALGPLSDAYAKENKPITRLAYVSAMGSIDSPAAMQELGAISLNDDLEEVRLTALDAIKRRPLAATFAVEYYKRFLLSAENLQVNRAAAALAVLASDSAIPNLINALVTDHKKTIIVGSDQTGASFDSTGRMQSFSPGGGARKKIITESLQNDQVLNALRHTVSIYHGEVPSFRFDEAKWREWYRAVNSIEQFSARRNP